MVNIEKAVAQAEKRIKYNNQYIRDTYDRVNVLLPKGTKDRIQKSGETMNSFVNRLVEAELERMGL